MLHAHLDESQGTLGDANSLGEGGCDEEVLRGKLCRREQGQDCQRHPSAQAAVHDLYSVPVSCAAAAC